MDTKELSPAFLTSLAGIVVGAILIGLNSTAATVFGWLLLLVALALNVLASLVSIRRYKGGPIPTFIYDSHEEEHLEPAPAHTPDDEMTVALHTIEEPAADTEAHRIIETDEEQVYDHREEKIPRTRPQRPRSR